MKHRFRFVSVILVVVFCSSSLTYSRQTIGTADSSHSKEKRLPASVTHPASKTSKRVSGEYAVQVGAFAKKENARKLRNDLIGKGYQAEIFENLLDGKNLLYLVWIGSFKSAIEADQSAKELKAKHNIDGVVRPRNSSKK